MIGIRKVNTEGWKGIPPDSEVTKKLVSFLPVVTWDSDHMPSQPAALTEKLGKQNLSSEC